jgi:hypothetical protein
MTKIVITEDGWVYLVSPEGKEQGLGDLNVDVTIEDLRNK